MNSKKLAWLIIAVGFFLRLNQYLFDRSLWLDEAFLALPFLNESWLTLLTEPLEYGHVVPAGFIIATKFFITLFGSTELALRFFPFLCGVIALVLFYSLAKQLVSESAALIAVFLFTVADSLIFYASEFKPYSSDVLVALVLFSVLNTVQNTQLTPKKSILLITAGIVATWFSYIAVIILATIGFYLGLIFFIEKQWKSFITLILIDFIWIINFLILYFVIIGGDASSLPTGPWVMAAWGSYGAFMPFPLSKEGFSWIFNTLSTTLDYPGSLNSVGIGILMLIVGTLALVVENKRTLVILLLPILLTGFISYLQKYPFFGRMILFLVPLIYLLIAEGIARFQLKLSAETKLAKRAGLFVQIIIVALLIDYHYLMGHKRPIQEIKPILSHLQQHRQNTDMLYVYHWTEPAFRYYAGRYGFNSDDCHLISPIPKNQYTKEIDYFRISRQLQPVPAEATRCVWGVSEIFPQSQPDLAQLRGRVWLIFSHIDDQQKTLFLNYLDSIGKRLDEITATGAVGYLYQL